MERIVKCTAEELAYLDPVMGQLSDGMWENSRAMEPYWQCNHIKAEGIERQPFTPMYCSRTPFGRSNPLYDKSSDEVRIWFARKLKAIVKEFLEDNNLPSSEWNRVNDREVDYLRPGQTVAGAYKVYDSLMGRESKSGKKVVLKKSKAASQIAVGDVIENKTVVQVIPPLTSQDTIFTFILGTQDVLRIERDKMMNIEEVKIIK